MDVRSKVYTYHTDVKWTEQRKGIISCAGKPDVQVATPPEFKHGVAGVWSPEELLVGAVAACYELTLVAIAGSIAP